MEMSTSRNSTAACTSSSSAGYSAYVGNLRSDISAEELSSKLQWLFGTVGVKVLLQDIQVKQNSRRKPAFAFAVFQDRNTFDLVVKELNGTKQDVVVFAGKELIVSSAHDQNPHHHSITKPIVKPVRKNSKKSKHRRMNNHKNTNPRPQHVAMETGLLSAQNISDGQGCNSGENSQNIQCCSDVEPSSSKSFVPCGRYFYVGQILGTEDRLTEYKQGGGKYLECHFKADVGKYICAFLNSEGGTLLIGVKDDCTVCGTEICNSKKEDLLRQDVDTIMKGFNPSVFPNLYSVKFIPVYFTAPLENCVKKPVNKAIQIASGHNSSPLSIENSLSVSEPLPTKTMKSFPDTSNDENVLINQPTLDLSSPPAPRKLPPLSSTHQEVNLSSNFSKDPYTRSKILEQDNINVLSSGENPLKVIEISVQAPSRQNGGQHTLYQNHKREVYIRLDGSVQGPLQANQIVEWGRCNMAESLHLEHGYLKQQVERKQDEIKMNMRLVDELVKQKEFLEKQYKEKENHLTLEIDKLKAREKEMQDELEQVKRAKSKVCAIL